MDLKIGHHSIIHYDEATGERGCIFKIPSGWSLDAKRWLAHRSACTAGAIIMFMSGCGAHEVNSYMMRLRKMCELVILS